MLIVVLMGITATGGYMLIEGWGFTNAFYMTVITLGTVGFGEVQSLTYYGRLWTILVIVSGVATIAYAFGSATRIIVEGEIRNVFRRRKVKRKISKLNGHYILCGYGETGHSISEEFKGRKKDFVVIDEDSDLVEELLSEGLLAVEGDATDEEILERAGIENAGGLISAVDTDAENVYITLTARGLNSDLYIVSRAYDESAEDKLRKAGADRIISPNKIGGVRMAQAVLQPEVVDFLELITESNRLNIRMEQVKIDPSSEFTDQSLKEAHIRKDFGVIIVAIKKKDGSMIYNPDSSEILHSQDCLITLGEAENLKKLQKLAN